jgi:hypothetical protein
MITLLTILPTIVLRKIFSRTGVIPDRAPPLPTIYQDTQVPHLHSTIARYAQSYNLRGDPQDYPVPPSPVGVDYGHNIDKGGCYVPVVDRESMQNHTLLLVVARQHGENLAGHCWEVEIAAMTVWESSYVEMWARCHSLIPYDRLEESSSWRTPTVLRTENLSCR